MVQQESGFVLQLSLDDKTYLTTNEVPEAFKILVKLETKNNKKSAYLSDEVYKLEKIEAGDFALGELILTSDSVGVVETETITTNDEWKLFKARRWLVSLLKFKDFSVKEPVKTRSRATLITIVVFVTFTVLAAAFGGIANSMANGAIDGNEEVTVDPGDAPDDEVLSNFFN